MIPSATVTLRENSLVVFCWHDYDGIFPFFGISYVNFIRLVDRQMNFKVIKLRFIYQLPFSLIR